MAAYKSTGGTQIRRSGSSMAKSGVRRSGSGIGRSKKAPAKAAHIKHTRRKH